MKPEACPGADEVVRWKLSAKEDLGNEQEPKKLACGPEEAPKPGMVTPRRSAAAASALRHCRDRWGRVQRAARRGTMMTSDGASPVD